MDSINIAMILIGFAAFGLLAMTVADNWRMRRDRRRLINKVIRRRLKDASRKRGIRIIGRPPQADEFIYQAFDAFGNIVLVRYNYVLKNKILQLRGGVND